MSYLQVTAVRPSSREYNTIRGSAIQCISPVKLSNLHNALKPTIGFDSSKKCTKLMKCHVMQRTAASRFQPCTPVCLFGGKGGESKNGDEGSPWKSMEKAMSSFKKEQSLEDVLRQQIEKKDYYDGGSDGGGGGGGGGGGSDGFGGSEDEGFGEMLDDILQATLALIGLIVMYLYMVANDQVTLFLRSVMKFVSGKKGPRLRFIMYNIGLLYQSFNTRIAYDPYWLEKEILTTPTLYDHPRRYEKLLKPFKRAIKGDGNIDLDAVRNLVINAQGVVGVDTGAGAGADVDNDTDNKSFSDDDDDDDNGNAYTINEDSDDY
ncbi:uncharacterized protein LOC111887923 [Lactuca sativa]|nr:uncharacterized protein LOC111887923 [Lactuca sativa]